MSERIIERSSKDMYIEDFVKYSIIAVRRRAFPEIRDSLKPVQRRALYDMFDLGVHYGKARKSARITGDTIGRFHPHGDSSVYGALENLANWWNCKVPLVAPDSNFGNVMGDSAPAQRYTEIALSEFAMDCIFDDLKKAPNCVNWMDNFDGTEKEPEYLPLKVPLLLVNGTFGIGVGTSNSNIPCHNLSEVIAATRALIKDPTVDIVLAPDPRDAVDVIDTDWKTISETGAGKYVVKGKIEIGENKKGCPVLYIKSLPDSTNSNNVKAKIMDMVNKKQLPMVTDLAEDSNNIKGLNIIITLKKGTDPSYVKEILYTKAGVRSSEYVNFFVIDGVNPKMMSYKEYLMAFLDFRATTKFRIHCNEYKNLRTRCHKLETYIQVIESGKIEEIVKLIRKQKTTDRNVAKELLIKKLNITDIQAEFILAIDIMRLSIGYLNKYKEEYKDLYEQQAYHRKAITDDGSIIMQEIDQELQEIDKKYGTKRRCKIIKEEDNGGIPKGTFKVILTQKNMIRKLPDSERVNTLKGDNPKFFFKIDNTENLLLFDNKGKVFKLPVNKIPMSDKSFPGTDIRILSKNLTADVIWMVPENIIQQCVKSKTKYYMVMVTKDNIIKRMDLEDFVSVNLSGLLYSKIKEEDQVTGITMVPEDLDVVVYSKQKALRVPVSEIPLFKRNAAGSKAMNTNDEIEGLSVLYPDDDMVAVITKKGWVNMFIANGLTNSKRAKAGTNVIKLKNGDSIFSILGVRGEDIIRIISTEGVMEVPINTIKLRSGVAAGDKIPNIKGDIIRCDFAPRNM